MKFDIGIGLIRYCRAALYPPRRTKHVRSLKIHCDSSTVNLKLRPLRLKQVAKLRIWLDLMVQVLTVDLR
jgi:hypothetical protein